MEKRIMTCIRCPLGCILEVSIENGEVLKVTGNTCKQGEDYGRKEVTNPTRTVTSIVKVDGVPNTMLPVKTRSDIPKDKVMECARALKNVTVRLPVSSGDIIIENVAGTGIPVIATRSMNL